MAKKMSMKAVIAATFGCDQSDVGQKYQRENVYVMGDDYYTTGATAPKDGRSWSLHPDQFWAKQAGTSLWVAKCE